MIENLKVLLFLLREETYAKMKDDSEAVESFSSTITLVN